MTLDRTLALLGIAIGVVALAVGIWAIDLTIGGRPEITMSDRTCMTYEREGHVLGFCGATRAYCEQRLSELSDDEKLVTPCRPDFETVSCWPDCSGTPVPIRRALQPRVVSEDIAYPCKRIPAG
jgi:hypothetical protein